MGTSKQKRVTRLIEPHLPVLRRTAYRLCRNVTDADDLVQDVCVRALERPEDLRHAASPRSWLLRIQYNLFVDSKRRDSRASRIFDLDREAADNAITRDAGPADCAEAALLATSLSQAWPHLTKDQQALLALYAEGSSLGEIADITGLPSSALKARLRRARLRLGGLIGERRRKPQVAAVGSGDSK